jgi:phosphorylcholine metabolism protein LicD
MKNMENIKIYILVIIVVIVFILVTATKLKSDENKILNFPKMTTLQEHELKRLLKIVHKNLEKNNIDYSMCGGTLLGAVRHKNIIPWDDDADIFIFEKDEKKIENINWEAYGCKLYKHWIGYKLCFIDGKRAIENDKEKEWNYPFVDIFISKKFGNKITYKNEKCREFWPKDYIYEYELFPLKLYKFGEINLYGPNKVYPYLDRYFGDCWETNAELKTSHIIGKDLDSVKFTINDYNKKNKLGEIKYLWVFRAEDENKNEMITNFEKDYVIIFLNKENIKKYINHDTYNSDSLLEIKNKIKEKHGGEFLILE